MGGMAPGSTSLLTVVVANSLTSSWNNLCFTEAASTLNSFLLQKCCGTGNFGQLCCNTLKTLSLLLLCFNFQNTINLEPNNSILVTFYFIVILYFWSNNGKCTLCNMPIAGLPEPDTRFRVVLRLRLIEMDPQLRLIEMNPETVRNLIFLEK